MMNPGRLGGAALLGFFLLGSLRAGDIRGHVTVPRVERRNERATQGAYGSRLAAKPGAGLKRAKRTEAENVVVFLKEKIPGAFSPPKVLPKMAQLGAAFDPRVLPVLQGTTVAFPNMDPIFHNIFSLSRGANFNLGRYPRGRGKTFRFVRPGMVRVNCDIHADMLGYILVLPHPFFARAKANGNYQISGVPPGKYHLVAWHDTLPPQVRALTVPRRGALQADFQF
jgi:hypothetical protein